MAWHLNLRHGFYSCRIPSNLINYSNTFGIKDRDRKIMLGDITFNLVDLEKKKIIRTEGRSYYRIIIRFDEPKFYISKSKYNQPRYYLNFSYPKINKKPYNKINTANRGPLGRSG
jgi:hypothetical protein